MDIGDTSGGRVSRITPWVYAAALILLTLAAYSKVHTFEYVFYDDDAYVTQNAVVKAGLSWYGVAWAFSSGHAANWHPLTWLSHMADVMLFGLNPAGPHLVNLGFHILNTLLLFHLLRRMTNSDGRSAFVAALFALHPLHVESVAWISERKDVLSTCFWFLTMLAYVYFTERRTVIRYAIMLLLFIAGLLSKPMVVTLPFTLLLLDFWPLGRIRNVGLVKLIVEKLPLIVLSALSSIVTIIVQQQGGAMNASSSMTLYDRVSNAVVSYCLYLQKTVWPFNLSAIYPRSLDAIPATYFSMALIVLLFISLVVLLAARRAPYAVVGWLWYLGTLVPVIGFVPIGYQAISDRYTYVPLIGIFMAIAWGSCAAFGVTPRSQSILSRVGALLIGILAVLTYFQAETWRTSETLFRNAIRAVPNNAPAHIHLAVTYLNQGKPQEALLELKEAQRIWPESPEVYANLGAAYRMMGLLDQAIAQYEESIRLDPTQSVPYSNLGVVHIFKGNTDKASANLEKAVELDPTDVHAHYMLAVVRAMQGRTAESRRLLETALRLEPDNATIRKALDALRRGELLPIKDSE
ncbi:MAG: tetratricopeptide repeat protein [Candidatus Hydrogenedentes bacterium]|nr:tetratricopeptide repeat protein [Candidatus Hydrogenedentota bacterium]